MAWHQMPLCNVPTSSQLTELVHPCCERGMSSRTSKDFISLGNASNGSMLQTKVSVSKNTVVEYGGRVTAMA